MNAIAPIQKFRTELTQMSGQFAVALPSHIKPEKFSRVVQTVVTSSPDLLAADRKSLFDSCIQCAKDGLIPDGKEAALVVFNAKHNGGWIKKVQYLPMVGGILKRIRNSGEISQIKAQVIYENDTFVWREGLEPTIDHVPLFPGDRGKVIGAYAIAVFKNGEVQFEVMDLNELEQVRQSSRSKDSGPWVTWKPEMYRKTVVKRLAKWLPLDSEAEDLIRHDNVIEHEPEDITPAKAPVGRKSKLDALEKPIEVEEPSVETEQPEVPTVIDAESVPIGDDF